jgi:hypothetical protein
MSRPTKLQKRDKDRSSIALGVAVMLLAHPNPASPYVWTALGLGAAVALVASFWFRRKAMDDPG